MEYHCGIRHPQRLIIPIHARLLKVTMPTATPTILDQISAEKTMISERLARLDTDREKIATQLTDSRPSNAC